ncbi:MAG: hypothetical protein AB1540_16335 [Bdellovibrionota bacterium]
MNEHTKRVLSKLHLSMLVLSKVIAGLVTLFVITATIHDQMIKRSAESCTLEFQSKEHLRRYGKPLKQAAQFYTDAEMKMFIDMVSDKSFHDSLQSTCDVYVFEDQSSFGDGWLFNPKLFNSSRPDVLNAVLIVVFSWLIPLILILSKKWLVWLTA